MRLLVWPAAQKGAGAKRMLRPTPSHDLHAQQISVELGRGRRIFRVQTDVMYTGIPATGLIG